MMLLNKYRSLLLCVSPHLELCFNKNHLLHCKHIHVTSNSKSSKFYDIVIAGGGMIGTTLACSLGRSSKLTNKSILLLEGSPIRNWVLKPAYSNRVVALNNSTRSLLRAVGAWTYIENSRYSTVKKLQVWDACSDVMITFNHEDMIEDIAYIVENDVLLAAVSEQVKNCENVTVVNNAKVKCYELPQNKTTGSNKTGMVDIETEDGTCYTCNLLVGADGANSQVRKAMGTQYLSWSYKQMGIVATLKLSEPTQNVVAWQRFLPSGPVALLPLTDDTSSLVWSTTVEEAKNLLQLSDESFVDAINQALWKHHPRDTLVDLATQQLNSLLQSLLLDSNATRQLQPSIACVVPGSRAAFPLGFGHAARYVSAGVCLVGDAAHRVHPLAGQGVNLGFGDIECLSELLANASYNGQELGALNHLLEYETMRQRHNLPTMLAIDGLHRLYTTTATPLVVARSLGLQLTHALEPLKKVIMKQAAV